MPISLMLSLVEGLATARAKNIGDWKSEGIMGRSW